MTEPQNNPPINNPEDEIDLIALAKTIWAGRKTIIITTFLFTIIGLFIAIFTPKQYQVTSIMVPQVNNGQNKLGGLSSLAAMAGYNIDMNTGSDMSPLIYPQIVQSIPFQLELMYTKLDFEGYDEKISLYNYYTDPQYAKFNLLGFVKQYTIGLPGTIIVAIQGKSDAPQTSISSDNNIIQLTAEENILMKSLSSMVSLNADQKQGVITLTAIMPEARAAAQLGQKGQELLQQKITAFKIEKAKAQLDFIQERYNEKEKEFRQIQEQLARFRDRNRNMVTELAKTDLERMQGEYQITLSVFTELAKQLENARIQVKGETPVFSIIEPISVPSESFKPKRKQILILGIFIGLVVGIILIWGRIYYKSFKENWKSK